MSKNETPRLSPADAMLQVSQQLQTMQQTLTQVKSQLANQPKHQESQETPHTLEALNEIQAGVLLIQENQESVWDLTRDKLDALSLMEENLKSHQLKLSSQVLTQLKSQKPRPWMMLAAGGFLTVLLSLNLVLNYIHHQEVMEYMRGLDNQHRILYQAVHPQDQNQAKAPKAK